MSSPSQPLAVIAKLLDLTERRVQQLSRERLARTIRNRTYPEHEASIGAAALVWSKAPVIVGAHARGALIRSKSGFWLAIPTPAAEAALRQGHAWRLGTADRHASPLRLPAHWS